MEEIYTDHRTLSQVRIITENNKEAVNIGKTKIKQTKGPFNKMSYNDHFSSRQFPYIIIEKE